MPRYPAFERDLTRVSRDRQTLQPQALDVSSCRRRISGEAAPFRNHEAQFGGHCTRRSAPRSAPGGAPEDLTWYIFVLYSGRQSHGATATRNADIGEEDADDATSHDDLQGNRALSTSELFRKLKRWAREHDLSWEVKRHESKGSHRRVYLGDRSTTVPWTKSLTTGVVHGVLKQLGIDDFF